MIRGALLTGEQSLYLAARVTNGLGWQSEVSEEPPWPVDEKIVAEELGDYLRSVEPADSAASASVDHRRSSREFPDARDASGL